MLWFQVGAIDLNRPGTKLRSSERAGSGEPHLAMLDPHQFGYCLPCWAILIGLSYASAQSKGRKGKPRAKAAPSSSSGEQSLTNIPLPIGHEAKGLVLPDFDAEGHLRGKFEAGTAHRIDQEHVAFQQLKITTYTPEDQPDLRIDMSTSVLDLKTRILSSKARTTIQRADFNIAGDSVEFDTNSKTGRLIGNIKMVITDKSHLTATPSPKE